MVGPPGASRTWLDDGWTGTIQAVLSEHFEQVRHLMTQHRIGSLEQLIERVGNAEHARLHAENVFLKARLFGEVHDAQVPSLEEALRRATVGDADAGGGCGGSALSSGVSAARQHPPPPTQPRQPGASGWMPTPPPESGMHPLTIVPFSSPGLPSSPSEPHAGIHGVHPGTHGVFLDPAAHVGTPHGAHGSPLGACGSSASANRGHALDVPGSVSSAGVSPPNDSVTNFLLDHDATSEAGRVHHNVQGMPDGCADGGSNVAGDTGNTDNFHSIFIPQADVDGQTKTSSKRLSAFGQPSDGGGAPRPVFADADAMKEKLRKAIGKKVYRVQDYYSEVGVWQFIATTSTFEFMTLAVIGLNAIWIAIDTDVNTAPVVFEAPAPIQIIEHLFCLYFSFEWLVRIMAFKNKRYAFQDAWFLFDTLLVMMMVFETWVVTAILILAGSASAGDSSVLSNTAVLKIFRLVRLTRMARMARLFRAVPELMILVKGLLVAMRSVFFTICLLLAIVYVFAIAFTQLKDDLGPVGEEDFPDVLSSMLALLLSGVLPDQEDRVQAINEQNVLYMLLFLVYLLLSALTVLNMLVGVLCEVVSVVSAVEKEELLIGFVKTELLAMLKDSGIDAEENEKISKDAFVALLEKPHAARVFQEVGVDVVGLVDFTDFIFHHNPELTFPEFMEVVLQLRGSNTATVKDIVDLRKLMVTTFGKLEKQGALEDAADAIAEEAFRLSARR